jgi:hypothetical protein
MNLLQKFLNRCRFSEVLPAPVSSEGEMPASSTSSSEPESEQADGLFGISDAEADAAWQEFAKNHLLPNRVFRLGMGMIEHTEADDRHLAECRSCREAFESYRDNRQLSDQPAPVETYGPGGGGLSAGQLSTTGSGGGSSDAASYTGGTGNRYLYQQPAALSLRNEIDAKGKQTP